jgi:protein-L-isoaspartate(D-aspartate) O-methyltransferase
MRKLEDAYLHKGLRRQLVQQLQEKGITDERVLAVSYTHLRAHET